MTKDTTKKDTSCGRRSIILKQKLAKIIENYSKFRRGFFKDNVNQLDINVNQFFYNNHNNLRSTFIKNKNCSKLDRKLSKIGFVTPKIIVYCNKLTKIIYTNGE